MRPGDSTEDSRRSDALRFRAALGELTARGALVLKLRIAEGMGRSECAEFFGVPQSAFDVLFLRAVRELRARLESTGDPDGNRPYAEEVEQAEHLAASIDDGSTLGGELGALVVLVRRLQAIATEIRAQDSEALRAEASSPRLRRRNLLWRALLLAIVATGLFLYFRPRPPPRIISRVPQEDLR